MKPGIFLYAVILPAILVLASCGGVAEVPEDPPTPIPPTSTSSPPTLTDTPMPALDPSAEPVHGVLELSNGFRPNPVIQPLLYGGTLDLATTPGDSVCFGFAEPAPDFAIDWAEGGFLRIFYIPDKAGNTSLTIQEPQGNWHCQDDTYDTPNPTIDFEEAPDGRFNIWVGGEEANQKDLGKLYITQVEEIDPADLDFSNSVQDAKLQRDAPARAAEIELVEGFTPDPMIIEMVAGGLVDQNLAKEFPLQGADLGEYGFTHVEPDVRLHWRGSGYLRIFFVADNGIDTFLFVEDPNKMDNLNDVRMYEGVIYEDPLLEFMTTFDGVYNIWVHSFSPSVLVPGKLYITTSTELLPENPGE
ncbi:MAG: hypothetical protein ISR58_18950 [Anaerolineales bacterium]|nr:hypothetical protein [Chloroflexota bacterium]MBL6983261.1 hypothetical protein [Anaerolineales bacterium]